MISHFVITLNKHLRQIYQKHFVVYSQMGENNFTMLALCQKITKAPALPHIERSRPRLSFGRDLSFDRIYIITGIFRMNLLQ